MTEGFEIALNGKPREKPPKGFANWSLRLLAERVEMETLLNGRYRKAEKVILVCDNLNTHTKGAFYEAFTPAVALTGDISTRFEEHGFDEGKKLLAALNNESFEIFAASIPPPVKG